MEKKFEIKQIGKIFSPYNTKEECPIQGFVKPEGKGRIEIFPQYEEGLDVLNNTPLIDIKPYVPRFDYFEEANN